MIVPRPSARAEKPVALRPSVGRGGVDALVLIAAVVIAAVIAVPGSMAAWVETEETSVVMVTTGNAGLHLEQVGGAVPQLSPGRASIGPVYALENTGDVPLEITGTVSATEGTLGNETTVTLSSGGDQGCGAAAVTVSPGASSAPFGRLEPGAMAYMCTAFSLARTSPDAAQAEPAPGFTITLAGAQMR